MTRTKSETWVDESRWADFQRTHRVGICWRQPEDMLALDSEVWKFSNIKSRLGFLGVEGNVESVFTSDLRSFCPEPKVDST